jgi:hypothetical protein
MSDGVECALGAAQVVHGGVDSVHEGSETRGVAPLVGVDALGVGGALLGGAGDGIDDAAARCTAERISGCFGVFER